MGGQKETKSGSLEQQHGQHTHIFCMSKTTMSKKEPAKSNLERRVVKATPYASSGLCCAFYCAPFQRLDLGTGRIQ
jgi:hypothetical protein